MKNFISKAVKNYGNRLLLICSISAIFLVTSCNKEDSVSPVYPSANGTPAKFAGDVGTASSPGPQSGNTVDNIAIPDDALIFISRSGCMGQCPVFTLTVTRSGVVSFNGIANVTSVGVRTFRTSNSEVGKLVAMMIQNNFLMMSDNYPPVPDAAQRITELSLGSSKFKKVVDYGYGIPDQLNFINAQIVSELGVDKLINGNGTPGGIQTSVSN